MKLLVATHITQGDDVGDYCWTVDGELVTPIGEVCANHKCGCARGFPGLASSRATTTAMVVDLPHIGEDELRGALIDSLVRGRWVDPFSAHRLERLLEDHMKAICATATAYPIGTIVCRDGDYVFAREALAA